MPLFLNSGTIPEHLLVETWGSNGHELEVLLGGYVISLADFLVAAEYVLTNTDLEPGDPRLQFVERIKSMEKVAGYSQGRERLYAP